MCLIRGSRRVLFFPKHIIFCSCSGIQVPILKQLCLASVHVKGLIWFPPQVPTASVTVEGASALNRVRWSSAGKEVAVGDSEGRVWIYDTGEV